MADKRDVLNDLGELAQLQPEAAAAERAIEKAFSKLNAQSAAPAIQPAVSFWKGKLIRPRNLAAVATIAAVALLLTQLFPSNTNRSFGFDEVQKAMSNTKSVQYLERQTIRLKDEKHTEIVYVSHVANVDGLLRRQEYLPADQPENTGEREHVIKIYDGKQTKQMILPAITLYPAKKAYEKIKVVGTPSGFGWQSWPNVETSPEPDATYQWPRQGLNIQAQPLGENTIRGKTVQGFYVEQTIPSERNGKPDTTTSKTTYWIDPATKLPVRVEESFHASQADESDIESVYDNLVFDAPIDLSLFSIDPPTNYRDLQVVVREMNDQQQPQHAPPPKTEFVFAEVQGEVAKVKTVQYITISNRTIGKNVVPEAIIKTQISGPHLKREELTLKNPEQLEESRKWGVVPNIIVHNVATGEYLMLMPDDKIFAGPQNMGFVYQAKENEKPSQKEIDAAKARSDKWLKDPQVDFFDQIRRVPENKATKLAEQTINGKRAVGFRIETKQEENSHHMVATTTYWIDTESKLPVRIEFVHTDDAEWGLGLNTVMKDFVYDAPLDEKLFNFTPPEGYTEMGKASAVAPSSKSDSK